jgi:hypothetical protein
MDGQDEPLDREPADEVGNEHHRGGRKILKHNSMEQAIQNRQAGGRTMCGCSGPTPVRSKLTAAKAAVDAAVIARDQECGRAGKNCRRRMAELTGRWSDLTTALKNKALTDQSAKFDAKLREAEATLKVVPPVEVADPQVEGVTDVIAWTSRGIVIPTSADLKIVRILGLAAMPALAGLLFAFAMALRQPPLAEV